MTETNAGYPTGMITRIEAHKNHERFLDEVAPSPVMMKLKDARRVVQRGETADSYCGEETVVIVTTTQDDASLSEASWNEEVDVLREFEPDFAIPTDYPTYDDDDPDDRREHIESCMTGAVYVREELAGEDVETRLMPLLKGSTEAERRICYEVFEAVGWECAAFYSAQYFTGQQGGRLWELVDDIETIVEETDGDLPMVLIGTLAEFTLKKLPPEVIAAAGMHRWRTAVEPATADADAMEREYGRIESSVEQALGHDGEVVRPQAVESDGSDAPDEQGDNGRAAE